MFLLARCLPTRPFFLLTPLQSCTLHKLCLTFLKRDLRSYFWPTENFPDVIYVYMTKFENSENVISKSKFFAPTLNRDYVAVSLCHLVALWWQFQRTGTTYFRCYGSGEGVILRIPCDKKLYLNFLCTHSFSCVQYICWYFWYIDLCTAGREIFPLKKPRVQYIGTGIVCN